MRRVGLFYCGAKLVSELGGKTLSFFSVFGNPLALLGASTKLLPVDDGGTVLGEVADKKREFLYSPYGFGVYEGLEGRQAFNGQRLDSTTNGYLLGNGHRLFAPGLMRFMSSDHLSPFGNGGINSYVYCSSDPVNGLDPSGRVNIPKLLMPWRRTGLTRFMKKKGLPKNFLKPLLEQKSTSGQNSIYVYEDNMDGGYKHFRLAWGEAPDLLSNTATSKIFAGRKLYVKGRVLLDLQGNSDKEYNFSNLRSLTAVHGFAERKQSAIKTNFFSPTEAGMNALYKHVKSEFSKEEWNGSSAPDLGSIQHGRANPGVRQIRRS